MNIGNNIDASSQKPIKRARYDYEDIEVISDSSVDSSLTDVEINKINPIETPIYLNKLRFEKNSPEGLSFRSFFVVCNNVLADNSLWRVKNILFSSYITEIEWVIDEVKGSVPKNGNIESILFISHYSEELKKYKLDHDNNKWVKDVSIFFPDQKVPYGVYHPKFMLIIFEDSAQCKKSFIRFIITSANLTQSDWELKSQSIWVQDFFQCDKYISCEFIEYLHTFLQNILGGCSLEKFWINKIQKFDFEDSTVKLIASVPGYFIGREINMWGHLRVRTLMKKANINAHNDSDSHNKENDIIVSQFSSIGRISEKWLYYELMSSLSSTPNPKIEIIFPTIEQVNFSIEGIEGGVSLPVKREYISKPWIKKLLHRWEAVNINEIGTGMKAIPHNKTLLRYKVHNDVIEIIWVIQGSHNLSNAAWGQLQKGGSQYCIRNFELGIFLHKNQFKFVRCHKFEHEEYPMFVWKRRKNCNSHVETNSKGSNHLLSVPLPFTLPPKRYANNDNPWNMELLI
ncbi:tyrosyl-DNA phodphodiesterase 1 (tdp1) [Cryptosporidium canis]|uniref:Tyrosyl-DNA phodphodiesterase 1 (Tdp1) n=1 Tax=Cryptosporidium canis TaxID=195482 RepID=A0A9D5HVH4_9CRYT|nr:tyrosyl-DNA phodphodiesterase 1 (tdp1) [Cryptosporidium canis]